jgi:hypothetical protein
MESDWRQIPLKKIVAVRVKSLFKFCSRVLRFVRVLGARQYSSSFNPQDTIEQETPWLKTSHKAMTTLCLSASPPRHEHGSSV